MLPDVMKAAAAWQRAHLAQMQMMAAAGVVIQQRMLQMALGTMRPDEAARMVMEKPAAFAKSAEMAARAAAGGKGHAAVAMAALGPYGRAAGANARRLSRRRR